MASIRGHALAGEVDTVVSRRNAIKSVVAGALSPLFIPGDAEAAEAINKTLRIGTSVRGVPIYAYRRNAINAKRRVAIVGNIHGDEPAGIRVANYLRDHPTGFDRDIELWVIPTLNPDGTRLGTRQNARKVDLNRNFPYRWKRDATPKYNSGPSAASEPETKAMVSFLRTYHPKTQITFHQPLRCVDNTYGGAPMQAAAKLMSNATGLPIKTLGGRNGSQSDYAYALTPGSIAMIVEFDYSVPDAMVQRAIRGVRAVANSRR